MDDPCCKTAEYVTSSSFHDATEESLRVFLYRNLHLLTDLDDWVLDLLLDSHLTGNN
jgi:hypothetical protein